MIRPALLLALFAAPAVSAQVETQHHRGNQDGAIVLYEHAGFEGRSVRIDGEAPDLRWINFNDLTSSMRIEGGRWEVCLEPDFDGACQVLDEDRPDMSAWAFNDRITSVRPVRFRGPGREAGITLYSESDYGGRDLTLIDPVDNLSRMNFNDVARSIEIHAGEWTVCVDDDYEGGCRTLDRSVSDLRRYRLDRRITSVRPGRIEEPPHREPGPYPGPGRPGTGDVRGGVPGVDTVFFGTPDIGGYAVASCLYESGYRCGQEAAESLCREAGLGRALHYGTRYAGRDRVWFLAEGHPGRGREVLVDLLCDR